MCISVSYNMLSPLNEIFQKAFAILFGIVWSTKGTIHHKSHLNYLKYQQNICEKLTNRIMRSTLV